MRDLEVVKKARDGARKTLLELYSILRERLEGQITGQLTAEETKENGRLSRLINEYKIQINALNYVLNEDEELITFGDTRNSN